MLRFRRIAKPLEEPILKSLAKTQESVAFPEESLEAVDDNNLLPLIKLLLVHDI